jgi:dienelactone hydrolase
MSMRTLVLLLAFVGGVGLAGCTGPQDPVKKKTQRPAPKPKHDVDQPKEKQQDRSESRSEEKELEPPKPPPPPPKPAKPITLFEARRGFKTALVPSSYKPDGTAPQPPPQVYRKIQYVSPAGKLAAYLTPDPGDRKKHPALLWAHGGFGGIGAANWGPDNGSAAFRQAGLIVMCPAWRGENENPGRFELFYGEVEDAVAAVQHLAGLPYVDPARIYMAGHSTGGTITLLTVEATAQVRAAFSFGGCPDLANLFLLSEGKGYGHTPFDPKSQDEVRLRSPINFVSAIRVPTFYFEGELSLYPLDAARMEKAAQEKSVPFKAWKIEGGDHFNIERPITQLLAKKILADTGPKCNIAFAGREVQDAFDSQAR